MTTKPKKRITKVFYYDDIEAKDTKNFCRYCTRTVYFDGKSYHYDFTGEEKRAAAHDRLFHTYKHGIIVHSDHCPALHGPKHIRDTYKQKRAEKNKELERIGSPVRCIEPYEKKDSQMITDDIITEEELEQQLAEEELKPVENQPVQRITVFDPEQFKAVVNNMDGRIVNIEQRLSSLERQHNGLLETFVDFVKLHYLNTQSNFNALHDYIKKNQEPDEPKKEDKDRKITEFLDNVDMPEWLKDNIKDYQEKMKNTPEVGKRDKNE